MHDVAGGRPGGLGGEHRSLSPASSPSTPHTVLPQAPPSTLSAPWLSSLLPSPLPFRSFSRDHSLLRRTLRSPLRPSRAYLHPEFSCSLSFRRESSFSPVSPSRTPMTVLPLFLLYFTLSLPLSASFPFSLCASCDRTTQPNNRHRRLKPENSAASSLPLSLFRPFSVCLSSPLRMSRR